MWSAFGNVPNYVEPFAGSLAVLLGRPTAPGMETVNDVDGHLVNFWRAVRAAPDDVAAHTTDPIRELDLDARHAWLVAHRAELVERLRSDPEAYDARAAGWWVWGVCAWLGSGFCTRDVARRQLPNLSTSSGVHRRGQPEGAVAEWLRTLSRRLARVQVACGSWERVVSGSIIGRSGRGNPQTPTPCGILLDPPYSEGSGDYYAENDQELSAIVRAWAIENGDDPLLRIALCGFESEHPMPASWACHSWSAKAGYGARSANGNAARERIWFSPHCLPVVPAQARLL